VTPTFSTQRVTSEDHAEESSVTEQRVACTIAQVLGLPAGALDPHTPLTAYGVDSLGAMQLVAALEDRFHCSLPESLLTESPDVHRLTEALTHSRMPGDAAGGTATLREQMIEDSRLGDDLQPATAARTAAAVKQVLLTGTTGFLGTALLRELIDAGMFVVCPVRARTAAPGERVRASLERYGLWRDSDTQRFVAIAADLEQPGIGLPRHAYDDLARETDAVYHAAADVNWVSDYASLRSANVIATQALLRFACTGRLKRFHFVSSLSVCMAAGGPPVVLEQTDMLPWADGLPLGYAQSKCVGESLVRAASRRGLPAQIYRPALLAGHSISGASNADDLIAALLKGCIQLGAAPDLDWVFDALPVDTAAHAILTMSRSCGGVLETFHLRHPRPRHWRECVLWLNCYGYPVRLEPYSHWIERLRRDARSPEHALYLLRAFFTRRIQGRTAPEHYEEGAHARIDSRRTHGRERLAGIAYPSLDAHRVDSYLSDLVRRGFLAPPSASRRVTSPAPAAAEWDRRWERALRSYFADDGLRVIDASLMARGSEHSLISELTSWKRGQHTGLFHYRLALERRFGESASIGREGSTQALDVIAKVKPPDEDVIEVAETIASMVDPHLHRQVRRFRDRLGTRGGHLRELEIYRRHRDDLIGRHLPRCYGTWDDEPCKQWTLLLEYLRDMTILDAHDPAAWTVPNRTAAIDGLAAIHATWLGRDRELTAMPWIGDIPSPQSVVEMRPLWTSLANHAAPMFQRWAGSALVAMHARLAATPERWAPALESVPRTLIHNDFNSRNVALRTTVDGPQLVAYDWELATVGPPLRDLAEFLCFVLPEDVAWPTLDDAIEQHRTALERYSGQALDRRAWQDAFHGALAHFLVSRLALYGMINRVRPLSFLPRVVRTWARLHELNRPA
jgi:thioester reductase-like protein